MRRARSVGLHTALRFALGTGLVAASLVGPETEAAAASRASTWSIETISTRPDMVTGGDALVRVRFSRWLPNRWLTVKVNGVDQTDAFKDDPEDPDARIGVVTGLNEGTNTIAAYWNKWGVGKPAATLEVKNHPIVGPVFSGERETPFYCETDRFRLPDGTSLGAAIDEHCSIATRVDYFYKSVVNNTNGSARFLRLADKNARPADLAFTTTTGGATVPYIIRMETGTVNRAIYQTTVLEDPGIDASPDPWHRTRGWNGRLIFTFGGGCINGWYRQGSSTGGVMDDKILSQGYAMASSSLNVYGNNCQDVTSAETMMMVKERFIEAYGKPNATMGFGCSGGSYQQHQIGDNYPGLLDGIIPGCSFPEVMFGTIHMISDARLLNRYFTVTAPGLFNNEQQRQVTGFLVRNTMPNVSVGAGRITPFEFCGIVPASERYHPITNPGGVRCDVYDHTVNVLGIDLETGFARRPLDNVGIQYGLAALNRGTITVDQFLDLNERIGGYDKDAQPQAARNAAKDDAIAIGYRSGRMTYGGLGLRDIPIIDYRAYNDDAPGGDIHVRYHSFSMRERLRKANGHYENHIMLTEDSRYGLYSTESPMLLYAINQLDQWIANINADESSDPQWVKVVRNKPGTLVEGCNARGANPAFIPEDNIRGEGACETLYPSAPAPREVAGADVASDIIKCQLKPIDWNDYDVGFDAAQIARLEAIFPNGVCDWSKPGVLQQPPIGTWQRF